MHVDPHVVERLTVGEQEAPSSGSEGTALPEGIVQRAEIDEFSGDEPVQEADEKVAQGDYEQEGPDAAAEAIDHHLPQRRLLLEHHLPIHFLRPRRHVIPVVQMRNNVIPLKGTHHNLLLVLPTVHPTQVSIKVNVSNLLLFRLPPDGRHQASIDGIYGGFGEDDEVLREHFRDSSDAG